MFIQWLIILFAIFALSRTLLRFYDKKLNIIGVLFWSILWVSVIVVAILPQTTTIFAKMTGVGKGIDFLTYVSIIVLFYLVFRLYIHIEKINEDITNLTKNIALRDIKGINKNKVKAKK